MNNLKKFESLNWCGAYIQYVELRKKGLKSAAKIALDQFLIELKKQNEIPRREFLSLVNETVYRYDEYNTYLPLNLYNTVVRHELNSWIADDPTNPTPLIWSRDIDNLQKAVSIAPNNQIALIMLGNMIANKISMNQHELNAGFPYSGNPAEDMKLIDSFLDLMGNIIDEKERVKLNDVFQDLRICASNNL